MNLHAAVRSVIPAVNPDTPITILRSQGYTTDETGAQSPAYLQAQTVVGNVQPLSGGDLKHAEFLNLQGVLRAVYLYGDTEGVMRVALKGGDLLEFPEAPGTPVSVWLVTTVIETWAGWSKVIVTLQTDAQV